MSESSHDVSQHVQKKVSNPNYKIPLVLPIIAIIVLVAMWLYAERWDPNNPEITVKNFYQAINAKQYEVAADHFSVVAVAGIVPEYQNVTPAELISKRPEIVKQIAEILASDPSPSPVTVTILSSYTRVGEYGAFVPFYQEQEGQRQMVAALLIKETGRFRMYNLVMASPIEIEDFANNQFKEFDASIKAQLEEK